MRLTGILSLCAASAAVLALAGSAPARPLSHEPAAVLAVAAADTRPGRDAATFLAFLFGEDGPLPATLTLYVPHGYELALGLPPGAKVGEGVALLRQSFFAGDVRRVTVAADDPAKYLLDPKAQQCAPGPHAAAWLAPLPLGLDLGTLTVVFFVDPAGTEDAARGAFRLVACLPSPELPVSQGGLAGGRRLLGLGLDLQGVLTNPPAGTHTWRLFVTPYAPGSASLDPGASFETRALLPLPQSLTVKTSYLAKTRTLLISGRLLAAGRPRAGAAVTVSSAPGFELGSARTGADGRFALRTRIAQKRRPQTLRLVADVALEARPCAEPPLLSGGCAAESVSPPPSTPFTATIPKLAPKKRKP